MPRWLWIAVFLKVPGWAAIFVRPPVIVLADGGSAHRPSSLSQFGSIFLWLLVGTGLTACAFDGTAAQSDPLVRNVWVQVVPPARGVVRAMTEADHCPRKQAVMLATGPKTSSRKVRMLERTPESTVGS